MRFLKITTFLLIFFAAFFAADSANSIFPPNNLGLIGYWPMEEVLKTLRFN